MQLQYLESPELGHEAVRDLDGKIFKGKPLTVEVAREHRDSGLTPIEFRLCGIASSVPSVVIKDLFTKYGHVHLCTVSDGQAKVVSLAKLFFASI